MKRLSRIKLILVAVVLFIAMVLLCFELQHGTVDSVVVESNPRSGSVDEKLDYNFHIRPILSDKCFFCHGPDTKNNKAGLRLDTAESAYAALVESDGHGIVPGNSEQSAVWQRVNTTDPELIMPPLDSKISLTDEEKQRIRLWIDQGAEYQKHWAFIDLPRVVAVPKVSSDDWVLNPIDNHILKELESERLMPSVVTEPLLWLRRVTFDLTGLPPTLDAMDEFENSLASAGNDVFAEVVDRLLASSAYGEHMAVGWLDAARYADSYGYQTDRLNGQWPYRDWVVKSFNENLSYAQFITYNLAGDLLPDATREQVQATAFNRLHRLTSEGGSIKEEFLVENAADRVHTFGTAMLGLTMECARCHDHKYDPISARDYYSMYAFFNSIPENGLYDNPSRVPSPTILLPNAQQEKALNEAREKIAGIKSTLKMSQKTGEARFQRWLESPHFHKAVRGLRSHFSFDQELEKITNLVDPKTKPGKAAGLKQVDGFFGKAIEFDGDRGAVFTDVTHLDRDIPFTLSWYMKDNLVSQGRSVIVHETYGTDAGYHGVDVMLEDGYLEARVYRIWPGNGIGVRMIERIAPKKWQHITLSYSGNSQAQGIQIYLDGKAVATEFFESEMLKSASPSTAKKRKFIVGQRFRDSGFKGGYVDELKVYERELSAIEVHAEYLRQPVSKQLVRDNAEGEEMLRQYFYAQIDEEYQSNSSELIAAEQSLVHLENETFEISVMKELDPARPAHILERGEYSAPRTDENRVSRDTFQAMLPKFPDGAPRDRLGLAQWLVLDNHPLTSRVFVNRIWHNFFGKGIVRTPENFGLQGALPSHPGLLDWLSRDFVDSGWDVKQLCRTIVLSATYRQSSSTNAELLSRDPENRLLARGPAYRLSAEQVRDLSLAASGLLVATDGGPPVSPYQPGKDLWRESNSRSPAYMQGKGDELHRRSLYSVWKRTALLPNMAAFDAPSREVCGVDRAKTNTPMQALVLLNDVQFLEASRALACRAIEAGGESDTEKIQFAFRCLAGRPAVAKELQLLKELLVNQREHFKSAKADAVQLLSHGETGVAGHLDKVEVAAYTIVSQAILNLDASIWKR